VTGTKAMTLALVVFLLFDVVYSQDGCYCTCYANGEQAIPGSMIISDCEADCSTTNCASWFPEDCAPPATPMTACQNSDLGSWEGDWVVDACSDGCLLDPSGNPRKDRYGVCLRCCDTSSCDCISGTITIKNDNESQSLWITANGLVSQTTTSLFLLTGNAGFTATGKITDTYDLTRNGDSIIFNDRQYQDAYCNISATRNPSTTDYLKLGLIIGAVAVGALLGIVLCCCNPCKKKTKQATEQYKQLPGDASGINYVGTPEGATPEGAIKV